MTERTEWESEIVERFLAKATEGYLPEEWYCPSEAVELLKNDIRKTVEKAERRGAERAVEFMRNASDHDMGWNDMLEAAKKVTD